MVRRLPAIAVLTVCLAGPAFAQSRCTGVLCDLYYSNAPAPVAGQPEAPDPTHLPCRDFICGMFGGRTPDVPPPVAQPVVTEPAPEAVKPTTHRKHKVHRAVAAVEPKAETAK